MVEKIAPEIYNNFELRQRRMGHSKLVRVSFFVLKAHKFRVDFEEFNFGERQSDTHISQTSIQ